MQHAVGLHLIIDVFDATSIDNLELVADVLRMCSNRIGATVLSVELHSFPGGGVTGVAILAESHMSIHTWPEINYAAVDIFVCGEMDPYKAIPTLESGFATCNLKITEIRRGP